MPNYPLQFPQNESFSFDVDAFNDAIESQGVPMEHWRAMGCPVGLIERLDSSRRFHVDHENCSGGYLYTKIGTVNALLIGNGQSSNVTDFGTIDGSTVQATFDREYVDPNGCSLNKAVYVSFRDRFYPADPSVLWGHWETVQWNPTGKDKLRFPVSQVETCIDESLNRYQPDVVNGRIVWGESNPGINPDTGMGRFYTVWYLYRPYWYVDRISHDARLTRFEDDDGTRRIHRMPFQCTLVREQVYENQERNQEPGSPDNGRQQAPPADGAFPAQ